MRERTFYRGGEGERANMYIHETKRSFASVMWSAEKCTWGHIVLCPMCFEFDKSSEVDICDIVTPTHHFLISADQAIAGSDTAVSRWACHDENLEENWNPFDDMKKLFVCSVAYLVYTLMHSLWRPYFIQTIFEAREGWWDLTTSGIELHPSRVLDVVNVTLIFGRENVSIKQLLAGPVTSARSWRLIPATKPG